jgi:AcrR family transcriptional regulator
VVTDILSASLWPHVTQATIFSDHAVTKAAQLPPGVTAPSLQSAIVQPDTPSADDRGGIIDAAYTCLSEPHSGPIPVAAILERAGVSSRAFYRHFVSKDELFLAMLRQESDALVQRLDRIADEAPGDPLDQLNAWIEQMFGLAHDPRLRMHVMVLHSDEVRAAKGYPEVRERVRTDRERSLVEILQRGHGDGSFPLADPQRDAVAISAVVSREMTTPRASEERDLQRARARVLDFALRALGADRGTDSAQG